MTGQSGSRAVSYNPYRKIVMQAHARNGTSIVNAIQYLSDAGTACGPYALDVSPRGRNLLWRRRAATNRRLGRRNSRTELLRAIGYASPADSAEPASKSLTGGLRVR